MSQPADLSRRVDRAEGDLTAIADTVVENKEALEALTERVDGLDAKVAANSATLAEHGQQLASIQETQREHGEVLNAILARLDGSAEQ